MKTLNFNFILILFILLINFYSCSDNDLEESQYKKNVENPQDYKQLDFESNNITFIYKDNLYSSSFKIINDSVKIFENKLVDSLINELKKNPLLSVLVQNQNIYIFDSETEKNLFKTNLENNKIKAYNYDPSYHIIVRVDYQVNKRNSGKGQRLIYSLNTSKESIISFPTMPLGWDNAISSCRMQAYTVFGSRKSTPTYAGMIFYDNPNYKGRSLDFRDLYTGPDSTGKFFSRRDYFSSFGFDRVTKSMKFYVIE